MSRPKVHRTVPLFTRISGKNDKFLRAISKKAGISKAAFLDRQLAFLRDNADVNNLLNTIEKIGKEERNAISKEGR